jgi:pyrroline-5-carboxylate reductase
MNGVEASNSFWLIGSGNMAGAMLHGWLDAGMDPARFLVVRPSGRAVAPGVQVVTALPEQAPPPELVMLGIKPQKLDEVAPWLAPRLGPGTILISILAGVEQASLRERFPGVRAVVKAMPNTPVALRKGVVELFSDNADGEVRSRIHALMAALGHAAWFDDERLFHAAGHLTGAGPAFLFRYIDALAAAGEGLGLPPGQAAQLALAMAEGAGALAARSGESMATLVQRVASPGGTTQAGLAVLDEGLNDLVRRTLEASRRRSGEMAQEARRVPR